MQHFTNTTGSIQSYTEIVDDRAGKNDYMPRAIHNVQQQQRKPPMSIEHQSNTVSKYVDMPLQRPRPSQNGGNSRNLT